MTEENKGFEDIMAKAKDIAEDLGEKAKDIAGDLGEKAGVAEEFVESLTGKDLDKDGTIGTEETDKAAEAVKTAVENVSSGAKDLFGKAADAVNEKLKGQE